MTYSVFSFYFLLKIAIVIWLKIKKKKSKKKKIYPSLVLGLDISTSCIGISLVYDDGVNKPVVTDITHIVPKISSKKKGIEALILRKEIFESAFLTKIKDRGCNGVRN